MKKRWAIALLLSSSTQASWHLEPRLYSGDELGAEVMTYYSLPWLDLGAGVQSVFDTSKNTREVELEVQLSKAFKLNENWSFSIGFGQLLGENWLTDYQFRYRVGDFSWLSAGYRFHLEEGYDNQNQMYLGYRFALRDTVDTLVLTPTFMEVRDFITNSQIYTHGLFGFGKNVSQWGIGLGMNFATSSKGVEFNMARTAYGYPENEHKREWFSLSGTYRWENFVLDDLTLKGGVGVAYVNQPTCCHANIDAHAWALTPDLELVYRISQYFDIFGGFRFFAGKGVKEELSPDALILGARAYWSRQTPVVTMLNDEYVPPTIQTLRTNTFALSREISQAMDEGLELSQFFIQPDGLDIDWQSLVLTLSNGQVFHVPLNARVGQLTELLPAGKQKLHFTLIGQERGSGAFRRIETNQLVMVNQQGGLNALLSVKSHILGETLHVQAY